MRAREVCLLATFVLSGCTPERTEPTDEELYERRLAESKQRRGVSMADAVQDPAAARLFGVDPNEVKKDEKDRDDLARGDRAFDAGDFPKAWRSWQAAFTLAKDVDRPPLVTRIRKLPKLLNDVRAHAEAYQSESCLLGVGPRDAEVVAQAMRTGDECQASDGGLAILAYELVLSNAPTDEVRGKLTRVGDKIRNAYLAAARSALEGGDWRSSFETCLLAHGDAGKCHGWGKTAETRAASVRGSVQALAIGIPILAPQYKGLLVAAELVRRSPDEAGAELAPVLRTEKSNAQRLHEELAVKAHESAPASELFHLLMAKHVEARVSDDAIAKARQRAETVTFPGFKADLTAVTDSARGPFRDGLAVILSAVLAARLDSGRGATSPASVTVTGRFQEEVRTSEHKELVTSSREVITRETVGSRAVYKDTVLTQGGREVGRTRNLDHFEDVKGDVKSTESSTTNETFYDLSVSARLKGTVRLAWQGLEVTGTIDLVEDGKTEALRSSDMRDDRRKELCAKLRESFAQRVAQAVPPKRIELLQAKREAFSRRSVAGIAGEDAAIQALGAAHFIERLGPEKPEQVAPTWIASDTWRSVSPAFARWAIDDERTLWELLSLKD